MPLLDGRPFALPTPAVPEEAKTDDMVYLLRLTGETFLDYEDFLAQQRMYTSRRWSCSVTGKAGLTLQEALMAESGAGDKQAVDFLARARQIAANADADANPRADAPSAPRVTPWSRARGDARGAGSGSASALADYVDEDLPDYTETFEEATRRLCARQGSSKHALFEVLRDAGPKGLPMKNIIAAVSQKGLKDLSKTKNANHLLTTVLSREPAFCRVGRGVWSIRSMPGVRAVKPPSGSPGSGKVKTGGSGAASGGVVKGSSVKLTIKLPGLTSEELKTKMEEARARIQADRERAMAEKEAKKAAERERKRQEAQNLKRYPIDDLALLDELRAKHASGDLPQPPAHDVPLPPLADSPALSPALAMVAEFTAHWRADLSPRAPYLWRDLARLVGLPDAAGVGAEGGAKPLSLGALYRALLRAVLEGPLGDGSATRAQRRWRAVLETEGSWPEVARRCVRLDCWGDAREGAAGMEGAAGAAAERLGREAVECLGPWDHVAVLERLCEDVIETGAVRGAVERRWEGREALDKERREKQRKLRQEQRELEDALKEMRRKQREAKKTELLAKAGKGAQGQGQKQKQGAGEGQGDEKDGEGEGDAKQGDEKQEEDGEVEDPVAEEKRKEARVREIQRALEAVQDKYAAELPGVAMRAEPLGYDRHYRRYWWGLAGRRDVVMVEEGSSDGTGEGAGSVLREGQSRWREIATVEDLEALLGALDPRGVREKELRENIERSMGAIRKGMARAARERGSGREGEEGEGEGSQAEGAREGGSQMEGGRQGGSQAEGGREGGSQMEGEGPAERRSGRVRAEVDYNETRMAGGVTRKRRDEERVARAQRARAVGAAVGAARGSGTEGEAAAGALGALGDVTAWAKDAARQHSPPGGWRALEERVAALGKEAESVTDAAGAAAVMRGASELLMEVEERLVLASKNVKRVLKTAPSKEAVLGSAEGGQAEAGDANGEGEGEGDMDVDHDKGGNGSPGANADPEEKGAGAHLRGGHLEGLFEFVEGYEEAARTVQPSLWVSGREREAWLQDLATAQTFARVAYCAACLAFAAEKMHGGRAPPPESLESGEDDEDEDEDEDESEGRAGKRRRK